MCCRFPIANCRFGFTSPVDIAAFLSIGNWQSEIGNDLPSSKTEVRHDLREGLGILLVRQVTAVQKDNQTRAGNLVMKPFAVSYRDLNVVVTPQQQRRLSN